MDNRIKVLDNGFVSLVSCSPTDESMDWAVVRAAQASFDGYQGELTEKKVKRIITYMMRYHHGSPFEHPQFTFLVKAPVVVWWNWVRHRIASYNFESSRFHKMKDEFYLPEDFFLQDNENKQASTRDQTLGDKNEALNLRFKKNLRDHYKRGFKIYCEMLDAGVGREQARLALPFGALYFTAAVTINPRSLMNFLVLRNHDHASIEIQEYAMVLEGIFKEKMPLTYQAFEKYYRPRFLMFTGDKE